MAANTLSRNEIKSIIQRFPNTKLTSDVYSWANKVGEIRKTVDAFLRDKFCGEAKKKVKSMPEAQLHDKVVQLLDENPDLYTLFIK